VKYLAGGGRECGRQSGRGSRVIVAGLLKQRNFETREGDKRSCRVPGSW
jgi:single-stranded DNA-binding protein